jgi:hypothetical protein
MQTIQVSSKIFMNLISCFNRTSVWGFYVSQLLHPVTNTRAQYSHDSSQKYFQL